jgi:hypothetical protein
MNTDEHRWKESEEEDGSCFFSSHFPYLRLSVFIPAISLLLLPPSLLSPASPASLLMRKEYP